MLNFWKNELLEFLKKDFEPLDVVVMPDFFLDRLITLDYDVQSFSSKVAEIVARKGGSVDGVPQKDLRGGNAINMASALAALDVKVTPIVCTSALGLQQIIFHLKQFNVDTSHIKVARNASVTTALEFKTPKERVNVMIRDLGSLEDFGPSNLTDEDYKVVENADYVCLFNWAGTRKLGTELAEAVFSHVKTYGKGKTYCDTADPTPNREKISALIDRVLRTPKVDVLSVNENEAVCYASFFDDEIGERKKTLRFDELALESARILAKNLPARVDLHTTLFSATFTKKREVIVPAFTVEVLRATGAGDAWNAGNLIGDGNALSDECRLTLANAVSACYLSESEGMHPTRQKLTSFIESST